MKILRLLLLPFSLLYALITSFRNRLYDRGILASKQYDLPVIVVGNLAVGGTGKSPMTEFIIRLLKDRYRLATLSRGYGRKTRGFYAVELQATAQEVGDEPLQFKHKFPDVAVFVGEDRCASIERIAPDYDVILLDDAYQHRRLNPSLSILLFDYASFQEPMLPLPAGNFRDQLSESRRATLIVITKTPMEATAASKDVIRARLAQYNTHAKVYFAAIKYGQIHPQKERAESAPLANANFLLVTGIANPKPLLGYLQAAGANYKHLSYADHYNYTIADIKQIRSVMDSLPGDNKQILTTEKDFQRLNTEAFNKILSPYTWSYLPIEVYFNELEKQQISAEIREHCANFKNS